MARLCIRERSKRALTGSSAHQLCLFHESKLVIGKIYKAIAALRKKSLPKAPPVTQTRSLKGVPPKCPLPEKLALHTVQPSQGFWPCTTKESQAGPSAARAATLPTRSR